MRCEEIRGLVWEAAGAELAEPVKQHLAACSGCQAYVAGFPGVQRGLRALAVEEPPEPSWGFSARVLRRLREEAGNGGSEFLERAGRRVILATLALVFALILATILPSSGPVRHQTTAYWPQTESASVVSYPVDWSVTPAIPAVVEVKPAAYQSGH